MIGMLVLTGAAMAQTSPPNKPIESAHRAGQNGLEGWTESDRFSDRQTYPTALVIARRRHVIATVNSPMLPQHGRQPCRVHGSSAATQYVGTAGTHRMAAVGQASCSTLGCRTATADR